MTHPSSEYPTIPAASTSAPPLAEPEEMAHLRGFLLPNAAPSYGSIGPSSRVSESIGPKLDRVPEERASTFISLEEAEEEVELDLEDQGYFVGKSLLWFIYPCLVATCTF